MATILEDTKLSMRMTGTAYDEEILRLLNVGAKEMGFADVEISAIASDTVLTDALAEDALIQFVKHRFWGNNDQDKKAFDEMRAEMQVARE